MCGKGNGGGANEGKIPLPSVKTLNMKPNDDMVKTIRNDQTRLMNVAIFFVSMDIKFLHHKIYG